MASRIVSEGGSRIGYFKTPKVESRKHLAYLRRLPCIACLCTGVITTGAQAAHVRYSCAAAGKVNPGFAARSNDSHAVPLCPRHHLQDQHAGNEREFWERLRVDPLAIAAMLWEMSGDVDGARQQLLQRFRSG
jgi:hypothetical protein